MKKKNKKKKRIPSSIRRFYPMLILVICFFMSIGYATINFNNLTIGGDILALEQAGIFITEVKYRSDINASLTKTEIKSAKGTILNSSITLSESDPSSSITYTITLFNSNNYDCQFVGATFDADFYDNQNIIFELSDNIKEGILLASKQYITFDITFKYKNGVVPNENLNTMNSYINFEFHSIAILQSTYDSDRTTFRTQKYREKIKKINFENKINIPTDAIESWDIGVSQNGDVMAYVVANKDDSNYYDLYIQSDTQLYANANMSYWFRDFNLVDSINGLELLDTSNTIDMSYMFSYTGFDSAVFTLDVSNFDTSNVIDMHYMFCKTGATSTVFTMDVSNFDTSNVTNMSRLFYYTGDKSTVFQLDVSGFNTSKVTDMAKMFENAGTENPNFTLDVSNFDTSNVTVMNEMFYNTGYKNKSFTLDVSNFDTSKVTDMSRMFYNTGRLSTVFTLDVSKFDTSNVTNMSEMFHYVGYSNPSFTLDVSNFDTSNVTNMYRMFYRVGYTSTVFTLDLSSFDTSKVTDMSRMFYNTGYNSSKFVTSITISNPKLTSFDEMFLNAAPKPGSQITVNYTSETSELVDKMIATKSAESNVVKGVQVD